MTSQLTNLFQGYAARDPHVVIELQNFSRQTVAALYMDKILVDRLVITETKNLEKYFLYLNGVGVYFSYYKIISNK